MTFRDWWRTVVVMVPVIAVVSGFAVLASWGIGPSYWAIPATFCFAAMFLPVMVWWIEWCAERLP